MTAPLCAQATKFRSSTNIPKECYSDINDLIMKQGVDNVARIPRHEYDKVLQRHFIDIAAYDLIRKAYEQAGWSVEFGSVRTGINEYDYFVLFTIPPRSC